MGLPFVRSVGSTLLIIAPVAVNTNLCSKRQAILRTLSGKIQQRNPMQAVSAACKNRLRNRSSWRVAQAQGETPDRGQVMDQEQRRAAKSQLVTGMQADHSRKIAGVWG